jgi:hypothetical protein
LKETHRALFFRMFELCRIPVQSLDPFYGYGKTLIRNALSSNGISWHQEAFPGIQKKFRALFFRMFELPEILVQSLDSFMVTARS